MKCHENFTIYFAIFCKYIFCLFSGFYPIGGMQSCQANESENKGLRVQPPLNNNVATNPARVRIAYVVPSNRTPQADYKENLQFAIEMAQKWYRDNMEQNGFSPKTFIFETEENSPRPKIHLVNVPETLLQNPDASFIGGLALGSVGGNGRDAEVTELSSSVIHLFNPQTILEAV